MDKTNKKLNLQDKGVLFSINTGGYTVKLYSAWNLIPVDFGNFF